MCCFFSLFTFWKKKPTIYAKIEHEEKESVIFFKKTTVQI